MTTTFLKFPDESAYLAAAAAAGIDAEQTTLADGTALDVIGPLYTPVVLAADGETILSGGELLPGWHVNLAGALPAGWDAYVISPTHPQRIFA
jgi:hypothetical protein